MLIKDLKKMKTRVCVFLILLFAILLFSNCKERLQRESVKLNSLENSIDSLFALGDLVGFSSCIIEGEKIVWSKTVGMADMNKDLAINANTLFTLASLSKTVTGAAFMHLYEKEKLSLDTDVNLYLPFKIANPYFPDETITLGMILTHTSSLLDNRKYISSLYGPGDQTGLSFEEYLKNCYSAEGSEYDSTNFGNYKPGDDWEYCNSNYVLIAYLIETISHMSFPDYCQENLFTDLEMNETGWLLSELDGDRIAKNYISEAEAKSDPDYTSKVTLINGKKEVSHYSWPGYPDGCLRTSIPQFANFMIMLMNHGSFKGKQILKPETVDLILSAKNVQNMFNSTSWDRVDMGVTWWLLEKDNINYFSHGGDGSGLNTRAFFDPIKQIAIIYFLTGDYHDKGYDRTLFILLRKAVE